MYQRHENELLGSLIHAHALQAQHTDFQTAGHQHQSTIQAGPHTT